MLKANRFVRNLGVLVLILSNSLEVISQTFTPTNILTLNNVTSALDLAVGNLVPGNTNKGIVIAHYASYNTSISSNNVPLVTLSGTTLSQSGIPYSGYNPNAIEVGDFNADGYDDITFSSVCNCSNAYILQGSSTGVFSPASITSAFNMSRSTFDIGKGSILNNGRISIVSGGNASTEIKTNTGSGSSFTFTNASNSYLNTNNQANSSWGFNIGDINGDGLGDIIAAYPTVGSITVFYNTGVSPYFNTSAGNVQNINLTNNGVSDNVHGVATGDIDGDGDLDISAVIRTDGSGGRALYVITNNGSGNFSVSQPITIATYTTWLEMADMNGDGLSDIVIPGESTIKIYNSSNGSFSSTANYSYYFGGAKRVALSDINNDGYIDITAISSDKVVVLLKSPAITINSSTLTNFSTCAGIESSSQSVSIQGINLGSTGITVTAPSNYEISLSSNSNFGQSLTLAQTNGSVPSTTIFIRLKSTASVGTATVNLTAVSGSNSSNLALTGTVTDTYTWTGATSTDPTVASNWNPAAVPCSGANEVIPSGLTNYPAYTNLTIDAGTTLTVQSGAKLDISGVLTNNGTLTIESGATLVQGASSTLAGSGTYNVKQTITGAGSTTPTGRFWYLGSPVSLASSSVYFGNAANVVKKRDESTNAWITVASGTPENLVVGKGYYTQAMANSTINFTGGLVNNGAITINGLSRTAGQGFEGFNLVSNPYPSYLNWDAVTKTNVDGTIWYRTHDGSNMVFDTYVANAAGGIGTNLSGNTATKYIPPMQSFWVRVSQGQTTGSLTLGNAMRSHFASLGSSTAGLRSTNDEQKLFIRMNLLQANKKDQIIVYVNETATNGFDVLDGEKMMQAGMPQFYTSAAGKKITINGLNSAKKQQALPITMELPTTGVHSFVIEDLEISNGLVWLEDKQEEIMQALEPGTVYEFYANSGINAERFVLHFQLIDNTTPINVYNEVNGSANFSGKGASVHAESAGVVVIKLPAITEGITDIQIRDAAGRLVYTGSTNTLETSVQLAQANGIYYVTLNSASGVEVRKVFIQQ
jgi:hypothetical protein